MSELTVRVDGGMSELTVRVDGGMSELTVRVDGNRVPERWILSDWTMYLQGVGIIKLKISQHVLGCLF